MSSSEDSDLEGAAQRALAGLLPSTSKEKYDKAYQMFKEWCSDKKVKVIDENKLLAYFDSELKQFQASTTWSIYSMLKATLNLRDNIDISKFNNLRALLKRKSENYSAKKSRIFTIEDIYKFLKDAPDDVYLATKVALIVGVYGACRRQELLNLSIKDIEYMDHGIKITVPKTKTKIIRQFVINEGGQQDLNLVAIFKKYAGLRPDVHIDRFFLGFRKGKCIKQPIGINTIGGYPKKIAIFLNLPTPGEYTGHCFRRSSASLLADSGANITTIKQLAGWKSDKVAESYIEHSLNNKRKIADNIMGSKIHKTGEVSATSSTAAQFSESMGESDNLSAGTNVTIISSQTCQTTNLNVVDVVGESLPKPSIPGLNSFSHLNNCNFYFNQK